jgi:phenylpropionate dioxygenase-like ring-hydroxylating dioxygenase large terminal subunit
MFINNWYVAAKVDAVRAGEPLKVRMLGADFVLFRDENGEIACLSNVCIHRGASLAHGKVHENGRIACPYHGWQFNAGGQCMRIPALGDVVPPTRARVDTYPVEELFGLVWVFLGDAPEEERPPLPTDWYPEYGPIEGWRAVSIDYVAPLNWMRAEENSIDGAHPSFVHAAFGSRRDPKVHIVPVVRDSEWTASTTRERTPPDRSQKTGRMHEMTEEVRGKNVATTAFHWAGLTHRIYIKRADGLVICTVAHRTPVDANNTRTFITQLRNYDLTDEMDAERLAGIQQAVGEDVGVVECVRPRFQVKSRAQELLTEADQLETAFREIIAAQAAKGWEIDMETVEREYDRQVFIIPSPTRRENPKNWVHKPMPMSVKMPAASDTVPA